jgi:catechol 2,3-dioxygenase-like lactoylglutathione lyase family enzyme
VGVLGVNHIAFRTPEPARLRAFYAELLGAEALDGSHEPLRAGSTLLVFFESEANPLSEDPDEIAFDVDAPGFDETLERARERWGPSFASRSPTRLGRRASTCATRTAAGSRSRMTIGAFTGSNSGRRSGR